MAHADGTITLAFVGYAAAALADRASAFEDEVLQLLGDHGARLLFRGRRLANQDESLPLEVHLILFPDRSSLQAYLADDRRQSLLAKYGEVFTRKCAVEVETIRPGPSVTAEVSENFGPLSDEPSNAV